MGLMDHERASHKLTLEAYDRMLPKMKARKEALKRVYDFVNKRVQCAEQRGDGELKLLCMAFLSTRESD